MQTAIALFALVLAQGGQQFDLACAGTTTHYEDVGQVAPKVSTFPWSDTYRIDLDAGLWCPDRCDNVRQFVEVSPGQLILVRTPDGERYVAVNRITGRISMIQVDPNGRFDGANPSKTTTDAQCEKRDFTPIPRARF
nr:hypothetical protein [Brevundimonas diminuta]